MSWSTIRKATEEDVAKLNARAGNFIARHDLATAIELPGFPDKDFVWALEDWLAWNLNEANNPYPDHARYLRKLWRQVVKRALGHHWAEGIAFGYVGFETE